MYIIFEGNECSGKSSQAKATVDYLKETIKGLNIVYREAPDKNNLYGNFARQILKQPRSAENDLIITISSLMSEVFNHNLNNQVIVQTRSFLSTLVYCDPDCLIDSFNTKLILKLIPLVEPPQILFFLDCPLNILKERLLIRSKQIQSLDVYETIEFLDKINKRYDLLLPILESNWTDTKFIKIDSGIDFNATQQFIQQEIKNLYGI